MTVLPISLIVRLPQSRPEWHIFCVSDKITSLTIAGIAPSGTSAMAGSASSADFFTALATFQAQIDHLATFQAAQSAAHKTNSSSVYHSEAAFGNTSSVLDSNRFRILINYRNSFSNII